MALAHNDSSALPGISCQVTSRGLLKMVAGFSETIKVYVDVFPFS